MAMDRKLTEQAQAAHAAGHYFFTPMLNTPAFRSGFSGNIEDWATAIQGVESVGCILAHWSVANDQHGKPQAYPLFRRRV